MGKVDLPAPVDDGGMLRNFRADPIAHPLPTPSGRIELYSKTIAGFGYPDCPGHPVWLDRIEVPTPACPLWLVSNQPATRLHSQLDFGAASQASKRKGREVAYLNPGDAQDRHIADGDLIRISSDRGTCLAAATITNSVMRGVINLPFGAW